MHTISILGDTEINTSNVATPATKRTDFRASVEVCRHRWLNNTSRHGLVVKQ